MAETAKNPYYVKPEFSFPEEEESGVVAPVDNVVECNIVGELTSVPRNVIPEGIQFKPIPNGNTLNNKSNKSTPPPLGPTVCPFKEEAPGLA